MAGTGIYTGSSAADRKRIDSGYQLPHGTGYGARREDISLAGKTGTAEIKLSKDDTNGTELGWFCIFTTQKDTKSPILLLTMTEDVKGRGGSGYVVDRSKSVLNYYFSRD